MLKPDWPCRRQNGEWYWLTTLVAAPRSSPAIAAAIGAGKRRVETHVAQRRRRHREHDVRAEVLAPAGGHADHVAVAAHGRDGRVEDRARNRGRRPSRSEASRSLRRRASSPTGCRAFRRSPPSAGRRRASRDRRAPRCRATRWLAPRRIAPRARGASESSHVAKLMSIELRGAVGRLGMLGIDPMLLGEALELVVDAQVVAEHRAPAQCRQLPRTCTSGRGSGSRPCVGSAGGVCRDDARCRGRIGATCSAVTYGCRRSTRRRPPRADLGRTARLLHRRTPCARGRRRAGAPRARRHPIRRRADGPPR